MRLNSRVDNRLTTRLTSFSKRRLNPGRIIAVFVISLCALAAGCAREAQRDSEDSIRVGVITSLTGSEARFGQAQKYGYEMALDEINA